MMQKPIELIEILSRNTVKDNGNWKHKNLYRQLYNIDLFILAYQNVYANQGNLTKINGSNIENISNKIIENLKDESYKPVSLKKGISSLEDKLVQECIRIILSSIYEPIFSENSHGFRPKKSCHTALMNIKNKSDGVVWWIEGNLKSLFNNLNINAIHNRLIEVLRKKIDDERFLRLIRKFLNCGYMEDWKYNRTMSGTSQGCIINSILANIYLNEFDNWIDNKIIEFNKGTERKIDPVYKKYNQIRSNKQDMIKRRTEKLNDSSIDEKRKNVYLNEIEKLKQDIIAQDNLIRDLSISYSDPMDRDFKRMIYTRYAGNWVIGIIGSKEDAIEIKEKSKDFFLRELKLELSEKETFIINGKDGFLFLGFYVKRYENEYCKTKNSKYQILMPYRKEYEFVLNNDFARYKNGKIIPIAIKRLFTCDDLEIMEWYNAKFKGIYNYYKIADNICKLQQAKYFWKISWGKTMANKYRSTKSEIFEKYRIGNKISVKYKTKKGEKTCNLFDEPLRKQKAVEWDIDNLQNWFYAKTFISTSLMDRLKANRCELCGKENVPLSMHHIKKVKDLKDKNYLSEAEKLMIKRNRKQLALCDGCHIKCHSNRQ